MANSPKKPAAKAPAKKPVAAKKAAAKKPAANAKAKEPVVKEVKAVKPAIGDKAVKPTKKRPSKVRRNAVTDETIYTLSLALRTIAESQGGEDAVLQLDFLPSKSGCVLRYSPGPRLWKKAGDGPWEEGHLQAVEEQGLVEVSDRTSLGTIIVPTKALFEVN